MERSTIQRVGTGVKPPLPVNPGAVSNRQPLCCRVHSAAQRLAVGTGVGQDDAEPFKPVLGQLFQGYFAARSVVLVGRADVSGQ